MIFHTFKIKGEIMNNQHTVDIVKHLKREIRRLHNQVMGNLDAKFNPIDKALDSELENKIDELQERLKLFTVKPKDSLSDMYLKLFA